MSVMNKPSPYFWIMTLAVVAIGGMVGLAARVF
jgi:hypothetical protein